MAENLSCIAYIVVIIHWPKILVALPILLLLYMISNYILTEMKVALHIVVVILIIHDLKLYNGRNESCILLLFLLYMISNYILAEMKVAYCCYSYYT